MCYNITWTPEKKEKAIQALTDYFSQHGVGECIMQSDEALIEAPELLADIADKILLDKEGIVYNDSED